MQSPLQPEVWSISVSDDNDSPLFFDMLPVRRSLARTRNVPVRTLALRSVNGLMVGEAAYEIHKDRIVVFSLACRKFCTEVARKLITRLQDELARTGRDNIWLDTQVHGEADAFYEKCGFRKKAFYLEDPLNPASAPRSLWLLAPELPPAFL